MPTQLDIPDSDFTRFLAFANELADLAAGVTLARFRAGGAVRNKAERGFDPVTEADRLAEAVIRDAIHRRFPDHGVLGEEDGHEAGDGGLTWVIDPIDGTRAFMAGLPLWTTLIALNDGTQPILGLIDQPYLGERFMGGAGNASFRKGESRTPLKTSSTRKLQDAVFSTTSPQLFESPWEHRVHEALVSRARLTRYGCDAYAYAMLAAGHIDVVVETSLSPWDVQALIPVVEGAGGVIGCWDEAAPLSGGNLIAAATPELFAEVKALIEGLE